MPYPQSLACWQVSLPSTPATRKQAKLQLLKSPFSTVPLKSPPIASGDVYGGTAHAYIFGKVGRANQNVRPLHWPGYLVG